MPSPIDRLLRRTGAPSCAGEARRLEGYLARALSFAGVSTTEDPSLPVELGEGERVLLVLPGSRLLGLERLPAWWRAGGSGPKVEGGTALYVGRRRAAAESGRGIDVGLAVVSDRRLHFSGGTESRDWPYAELAGYLHHDDPPFTALVVDGAPAEAVLVPAQHAEDFRFALALGIARATGETDAFVADLRAQLAALGSTPPTLSAPAGWYPDPWGAARLRFWDGASWTAHHAP